ncbi:MAG: VWA domain-containing protein, partial [Gemmatimonadota bacterium]|nr:VWA domain-containing protein [Gemmatimonadota bacterium]
MDQQQTKTRGVADLVFLIDVSGSMAPIIDALKRNIELFIDSLSAGEGNNVSPVRDWRAKAVGYRDFDEDPLPFGDNPFVRDVAALKAQLTGLVAEGGGDEPESLLDALFKIANMGQMERGAQSDDASMWRYRSDAARVVIVFTDASFKETMSIPEARGGGVADVTNAMVNNRIILS